MRRTIAGSPIAGQEVGRAARVAHTPHVCFLGEHEESLGGVLARARDSDVGQDRGYLPRMLRTVMDGRVHDGQRVSVFISIGGGAEDLDGLL